jgi:hypothetical protein
MTINATLHIRKIRQITGSLHDLRCNKCIGFTQVITYAKLDRVRALGNAR